MQVSKTIREDENDALGLWREPAQGAGLLLSKVEGDILLPLESLPQRCSLIVANHSQNASDGLAHSLAAHKGVCSVNAGKAGC